MSIPYTPKPWRVEQPVAGFSAIRGPNNELIFGLAAGDSDEKQPDDVCNANATLLELAPEMYVQILQLQAAVKEWAALQGDDACHYYPDIFRRVADILGIEVKLAAPTIQRETFEASCRKFAGEMYDERLER